MLTEGGQCVVMKVVYGGSTVCNDMKERAQFVKREVKAHERSKFLKRGAGQFTLVCNFAPIFFKAATSPSLVAVHLQTQW